MCLTSTSSFSSNYPAFEEPQKYVMFLQSSFVISHWRFSQMPDMPNGPLNRNVKLQVAHALGMTGTFSPPLTSKETTSKRSRHASRHVRHALDLPRWHSRRMRNPQCFLSGKRPMLPNLHCWWMCYIRFQKKHLATRVVLVHKYIHFIWSDSGQFQMNEP